MARIPPASVVLPSTIRRVRWTPSSMQHLARENRMFVIGVNPVLHVDRIPLDFPDRDRLVPHAWLEENGDWVEQGNSVIVDPNGAVIAGPVREREETLIADLDLGDVHAARRFLDPVGHYNRPDVFRLRVDIAPRRPVVEVFDGADGVVTSGSASWAPRDSNPEPAD